MEPVAAAQSKQMVIEMKTNLAVMLDEMIQRGGELQVKRKEARIGSKWELTLWSPPAKAGPGRNRDLYPTVEIRLQADTSLALVAELEQALEGIAHPTPEPDPESKSFKIGEQQPLPVFA